MPLFMRVGVVGDGVAVVKVAMPSGLGCKVYSLGFSYQWCGG